MFEAVSTFSTVYAQYYANVYRYFCACFDKNAAEDLTQSVFTSLWRQMQKIGFLEPDNWRAWIFRAAVNQKNDFLRIKQRNGIKMKRIQTVRIRRSQAFCGYRYKAP